MKYSDVLACSKSEILNSEELQTTNITKETLINFKCPCGVIDTRQWRSFQTNSVCKQCSNSKRDIKEIKEEIAQYGIELLDTVYEGREKPLTLKCTCGKTFVKNFRDFTRGKKLVENAIHHLTLL